MGELARTLRVDRVEELPEALTEAGVVPERPALVLVGGAGGMGEDDLEAVGVALRDAVVPVVERHAAVVVDGGTDSGVMRLIGRARSAAGAGFPLVGVAAAGTVIVPGAPAPPLSDAAPLEPHHTLFVLIPGTEWGDEAPWIGDVATVVAGARPSVTVLINGGRVAYADAEGSLRRQRPVVVVAGTGRTADAIAAARGGHTDNPRAAAIAASPLTTVAELTSPDALRLALDAALGERRRPV